MALGGISKLVFLFISRPILKNIFYIGKKQICKNKQTTKKKNRRLLEGNRGGGDLLDAVADPIFSDLSASAPGVHCRTKQGAFRLIPVEPKNPEGLAEPK